MILKMIFLSNPNTIIKDFTWKIISLIKAILKILKVFHMEFPMKLNSPNESQNSFAFHYFLSLAKRIETNLRLYAISFTVSSSDLWKLFLIFFLKEDWYLLKSCLWFVNFPVHRMVLLSMVSSSAQGLICERRHRW